MGKKLNLRGRRFGRLIVIKETEHRCRGYIVWYCKCDCGNTTWMNSRSLMSGNTKSCGCYRRDQARKKLFRHGESSNSIYHNWLSMKLRCTNPKDKAYRRYGGRGIKICDEWLDYMKFKHWALENGYEPGLTIDRIDNDGNYEPDNCQFITQSENSKKYWKERKEKLNQTSGRNKPHNEIIDSLV